jgi:hypothetical protein
MQTKNTLKLRCDEMLLAFLGPEFSQRWWHNPNKAFNGLTPEGQWILDHIPVYNYLINHCSGDYH